MFRPMTQWMLVGLAICSIGWSDPPQDLPAVADQPPELDRKKNDKPPASFPKFKIRKLSQPVPSQARVGVSFELAVPKKATTKSKTPAKPQVTDKPAKPPVAFPVPAPAQLRSDEDEAAVAEIIRLRTRFGNPLKGTALESDTPQGSATLFSAALEAVASSLNPRVESFPPAMPDFAPAAQPQVGPYCAPACPNCQQCPGHPASTLPPMRPMPPMPPCGVIAAFPPVAPVQALVPAAPTPSSSIRDAARRIDHAAAELEDQQLYQQADTLRELAQQLRLQARELHSARPTPPVPAADLTPAPQPSRSAAAPSFPTY